MLVAHFRRELIILHSKEKFILCAGILVKLNRTKSCFNSTQLRQKFHVILKQLANSYVKFYQVESKTAQDPSQYVTPSSQLLNARKLCKKLYIYNS